MYSIYIGHVWLLKLKDKMRGVGLLIQIEKKDKLWNIYVLKTTTNYLSVMDIQSL